MGLFDFFSDAVDFVKDMVTTPEPRFLKGDIVHINPLGADIDIYDALSKRNLTTHQKNLYWEVMEDDGLDVTMHQVGFKGTRAKVGNLYLIKVQQQSPPSNSNYKKSESKQSENFSSNSVTQSPQIPPYTSTNLKIGDLVKFNSTASTYYNAKSGAKISLSSKEKSTVWIVTQFDISSNKIVHLMSLSDNSIEIKAKISVLVISDKVSQPTNSVTNTAGRKNNMAHNNNYNGYQFTALGLSGSGKTCFMAGMYYKMTGGVSGYTLKADDDDSVNLTAYYEQMTNAEIGADRFPGGTNQSTDYSFELQYGYKTLEKFRWVDYAGGTLKSKNNGDAEEYQQLKNDIAKSEVLYIFVDGGLFIDEDVEDASSDSEKIEILTDIVMDSCSRQINHFLSEYTSERKKLPPIAIIVTKYDLAVKALGKADNSENMEMLYKVIQRAFNPLFPDPSMYTGDEGHTSMVGIIPVSLGSKISENNYTGKLRPINMHMPAYVGIWFMLKSKNNQDISVKKLSDEIEDSGIKFWLDGKTGKFSTLAEGYLRKIKEGK